MRIIIDSGIDKDHPLLKEYDIRQIKYKKSTNNSFIKREWLNRFNIKNYRHAYNLIFEYIETFYNTVRSTATVIICLLTNLKNCIKGLSLCRLLSWQNFSFYFVLSLDTGPSLSPGRSHLRLNLAIRFLVYLTVIFLVNLHHNFLLFIYLHKKILLNMLNIHVKKDYCEGVVLPVISSLIYICCKHYLQLQYSKQMMDDYDHLLLNIYFSN